MFATILLPNFYLQAALRHEIEIVRPIALIDDQETKAVVIQLNPAAEKMGVRCGMTPSQGLARCLELIVKTRTREQERLLDELLLQFSSTLSPYVEATAPGVCTVQFSGSGFKGDIGAKFPREEPLILASSLGEKKLPLTSGEGRGEYPQTFATAAKARDLGAKVERVIEQLRETGINARAGIGPTPDTSLLAAHLARPVLQVGDTKTFLASLPIETLAIA